MKSKLRFLAALAVTVITPGLLTAQSGSQGTITITVVDQTGAGAAQIDFSGLQLPQVLGISVVEGDPLSLDSLRGGSTAQPTGPTTTIVQIPVIPEECN